MSEDRTSVPRGTGGQGRARLPVSSFEDLIVWQRAMELADLVYGVTRAMPPDERFGLTNQMRRAAVSIPSNIAEGFGRQTRADYLRFLRISRGSLAELQTQLRIAARVSMLSDAAQVLELAREVSVILQAVISGLERKGRQ